MVRLQVTLRVTGRCINSRLKWDADLNVLVLPSLKEVVARVAEMSKQVEKDELVEELYKFVSAGTEIFQERFSPARYPEVQQWLQQGYQVTEVVGTPVNSESCAVSWRVEKVQDECRMCCILGARQRRGLTMCTTLSIYLGERLWAKYYLVSWCHICVCWLIRERCYRHLP